MGIGYWWYKFSLTRLTARMLCHTVACIPKNKYAAESWCTSYSSRGSITCCVSSLSFTTYWRGVVALAGIWKSIIFVGRSTYFFQRKNFWRISALKNLYPNYSDEQNNWWQQNGEKDFCFHDVRLLFNNKVCLFVHYSFIKEIIEKMPREKILTIS